VSENDTETADNSTEKT